jgi:hypothetical protein
MNYELGRIQKEASMAYIKVLWQISSGGIEEYHDKSRSRDLNGARSDFERRTLQLCQRNLQTRGVNRIVKNRKYCKLFRRIGRSKPGPKYIFENLL